MKSTTELKEAAALLKRSVSMLNEIISDRDGYFYGQSDEWQDDEAGYEFTKLTNAIAKVAGNMDDTHIELLALAY